MYAHSRSLYLHTVAIYLHCCLSDETRLCSDELHLGPSFNPKHGAKVAEVLAGEQPFAADHSLKLM
jgi:hypothetical protein